MSQNKTCDSFFNDFDNSLSGVLSMISLC